MPNAERLAKKQLYFDKLINLIETYPNILILHCDYVASKQIQEIRIALRGKGVMLMGKNTMIRTALRKAEADGKTDLGLSKIVDIMRGNLGFIFCISPMDEVREIALNNRRTAKAKAGVEAQADVFIPAGPSGLDPSATNFFQALNIGTKIIKGQIEITTEVHLIKKGNKVQMSEQVLLNKLGIVPFEYGFELVYIYQNGAVFSKEVLDITDDILVGKFMGGVANVAAMGREIGVPTQAALPHMITNAFKNIASLVQDIDYTFDEVKKVKEFFANPEAFAAANASAAPAAGGGGGGGGGGKAAAAAPPPVEEEEEEADFDLFG